MILKYINSSLITCTVLRLIFYLYLKMAERKVRHADFIKLAMGEKNRENPIKLGCNICHLSVKAAAT